MKNPAAHQAVSAVNGALVNRSVLENERLVRHQDATPYELTDRVWVLPGTALNAAVIVGDDGLIVWESGEHLEHGKQYREAIRRISTKPIKAIIYSHTHYALGARAILEGEDNVAVIGHARLNENMRVAALGSYFPEIQPLQHARAMQHAQALLPQSGDDAQYGFVIEHGPTGFVPVNTPVAHGEMLTIAGVRMQFFTEGGSDTDDCVTVWLPDQKVALNNILWPWQPNFYTPRGAKFRDPRVWSEALRHLLALEPAYLISQHARSITGAAEIERTLRNYLDFTMLVLDQTLRGVLAGKGPDDLRGFIELPRHLKEEPWLFEAYGRLDWHAPYIMNHALGWWDGDAATLERLAPAEIAGRMTTLLGGRARVLDAVHAARAQGDYAWALELLNYPLKLAPDDAELRQLKASLLRSSAQATTASIARGFMLSQALALEGKIDLPRLVPPSKRQIAADPATYVDHLRVRVNPLQAQHIDAIMRFDFIDGARPSVALHVRRGVAEFIARPHELSRHADFILTLDGKTFAQLFVSPSSLQTLLNEEALRLTGDASAACAVLATFDALRA
ncbi:Alkyl sulfatase (plasmid) [Burkholderia sp. YI23]|nr:Alkyl sulfatase [Burkholderia sp. YI23]